MILNSTLSVCVPPRAKKTSELPVSRAADYGNYGKFFERSNRNLKKVKKVLRARPIKHCAGRPTLASSRRADANYNHEPLPHGSFLFRARAGRRVSLRRKIRRRRL
jgi:hypothetical protein